MNAQPRNKVLILIIGILLIANIATLSFFLMNKKEVNKGSRPDRKAMIMNYLEKEVGFSKDQLQRYDKLGKEHQERMKPLFEEMSLRREAAMRSLASYNFTDAVIDSTVNTMADRQRNVEVIMFNHIKDIRSICTAAQLPVFDSGFYKIIVKKGNGKKVTRD